MFQGVQVPQGLGDRHENLWDTGLEKAMLDGLIKGAKAGLKAKPGAKPPNVKKRVRKVGLTFGKGLAANMNWIGGE